MGEVWIGIAAVAAVVMLAACGGSDDSTTNPQSKNYDPATTALANAGLQVCSEEQESIGAQLSTLPGLQLTRKFDVAKDCQGATVTPNKVTLFQFSNKPDFEPGVQSIKSALPLAAVYDTYPLVIAATGPDREANLEAVKNNLPPGLGCDDHHDDQFLAEPASSRPRWRDPGPGRRRGYFPSITSVALISTVTLSPAASSRCSALPRVIAATIV